MYEIHNLMYFYHRIYPASGPCRKGNEPITVNKKMPLINNHLKGENIQ